MYSHSPDRPLAEVTSYAAARWAKAMVVLVFEEADTKTVPQWGRLAGASRATLGTWCRATQVTPRRSLQLGRLLRALRLTGGRVEHLQHVMDIVEPRTIHRLLTSAGMHAIRSAHDSIDLIAVLRSQRLIRNDVAITMLEALLADAARTTPLGARPPVRRVNAAV